jgi:hypothetical protein
VIGQQRPDYDGEVEQPHLLVGQGSLRREHLACVLRRDARDAFPFPDERRLNGPHFRDE